MNVIYLIALSCSALATAAVLMWIRRIQQRRKPTVTDNTGGVRVRKRFSGRRVYSLPLFGKHKWLLHFIYGSTVIVPVSMAVVYWRAAGQHPGGMTGGNGYVWFVLIAAAVWAVSTIVFLRAVVRYRRLTTITLTADGVRYFAPKVGLFPRREVFMRWDEIENISRCSAQQPSVISVKSATDNFVFDSLRTIEVLTYPKDGEYPPVENGDDLYRNLVEYSGMPLPPDVKQTSPGLFRRKIQH